MATLILSGVGRLVAGPLGGAVGGLLGNALDHRLLGPKARQGARLSDLAVQASEYGAVLPKLYGRTRVAGTVIWATDLVETRARVSQGKGRPKVDTYSYTASFAVALSARAILRVERIWADGSLLRGAAGDWKRDAVMRVQSGGEGRATPLGGANWRLSELCRGRCGTGSAIAGHTIAEDFALIESASIRYLASEDAIAGATVSAQGVGDVAPVEAVIATADRALRPLAPVWLNAIAGDEGIVLNWIRCSRDGFIWRDGVDAPLAEEREAYLVAASGGSAAVSVEVSGPQWTVSADFAAPGTPVTATVRQIGRHGLSDYATINFTL